MKLKKKIVIGFLVTAVVLLSGLVIYDLYEYSKLTISGWNVRSSAIKYLFLMFEYTAAVLLAALIFAKIKKGRIFLRKKVFYILPLLLMPIMIYSYIFTQNHSLQNLPVSGDEASMYFQAELFSDGKLFNHLPEEIGKFFKRHHVIINGEKEFTKYPPGFSALLALFMLLNIGWVTNILVTLLSFLLIYHIVYKVSGYQITAILSSLLYVFATTTIFHAASYFSHPLVQLLLLMTILLLIHSEQREYLPGKHLFSWQKNSFLSDERNIYRFDYFCETA